MKPYSRSHNRCDACHFLVETKLDEQLETEIIEEVSNRPMTWLSSLVVVPKPNGDIRICVDMQRVNEAIVRERREASYYHHRGSSQDLSGSTVFSKLGLNWGFNQLELVEETWEITTFVTHQGFDMYCRLIFSIASALENYQKIVKDVLCDCKEAANIADNLIVHG